MKTVAILGSTGSIGRNTLKVVSQLPDKFKVVALVAGRNVELLAEQVNEFHPQSAAIMDEAKFAALKELITPANKMSVRTKLFAGQKAAEEVASFAADITVMAISGSAALIPVLNSLKKTKRLALANKECLVMAGDIIMREAQEHQVEIIPIDSEHSAIFQCLKQEETLKLEKIYLTGSGGPLKDLRQEDIECVAPSFALRHPRWQMGKKISIDSATLMNKGFEVVEARHLFDVEAEKIEVLIHPEALIHSLVQFVDGTILAQLAVADMYIPIQYALTYPQRVSNNIPRLDFSKIAKLSFQKPDLVKFPCLGLAMQVARQKGLAGAVLCAADEECVEAFLEGKIKITDFAPLIESVLAELKDKTSPTLDEVLDIDKWAREKINSQFKVEK